MSDDIKMVAVAASHSVAYGWLAPGDRIIHRGRMVDVVKVDHVGKGTPQWQTHLVLKPTRDGGRKFGTTVKATDSTVKVRVEAR